MRLLSSALAVLLLATACGTGGDPADAPAPAVAARGVTLARLDDQVAEVAARQAEADPLLADVLTAVREVDAIVARLRDPGTVDDAQDLLPRVQGAVDAAELEPVRPAFLEVAFAVDRARATLATAREAAPPDERSYLDAEDAALVAMRTYARESDALTQILELHWPLYSGVHERTVGFADERWLYRTSEEASQAYEVELSGLLAELGAAQEELRAYRAVRDAAAGEVNVTARAAAAVWREVRAAATTTPS